MIRGELRLCGTSTSWPLHDRTVVGRSSEADVTMAVAGISRQHFVVEFDTGVPVLRDLGSRNGTAVNGHIVEPGQGHRLGPGDIITVGGELEVEFLDLLATPYGSRIGRLTGVWIDPDTDDVWVDAHRVEPLLSPRQLLLLKVLDDAAGSVVSRHDIIVHVWGDAAIEGVSDDSVTSLVKRLRARLDSFTESNPIEIVRGRGIRLTRD